MTATTLDAATRVRTLIALTEELTDIFVKENQCLAERKPREMAPLQADKARLAAAYAQSIREIAADRCVVDGAGDALMEQLRAITQEFEARATDQRALLDGARYAAEGVLRAVADEAGKAERDPAYGASSSGAKAPARAAAIAVNEEA